MIASQLQAARVALARGALADAMSPLLDAWQQTRAPELAALIEALAARIWPAPPLARSLGGLGPAATQPTSANLAELLARLPRVPTQVALVGVQALADVPDDPRMTTALLALLDMQPATTESAPLAAAIIERLVALRDPRALARLQERGLDEAVRALPALSPDEVRAIAEIASLVDAPNEDLLARILETPFDLAARQVYGDWLQERGDPRGELIALQLRESLDADGEARVAALVRKHGGSWVGHIRHVARRESMVFAGGFLVRCVARKRMLSTEKWQAVLGEPLWATVEELSISGDVPTTWARRIVAMPQLRALRRLHIAHPSVRDGLSPQLTAKLVESL